MESPHPPNGEVVALLGALSNPSDHDRHRDALAARDSALSASLESYCNLVRNFARVFACPSPSNIPSAEIESLHRSCPSSLMKLQQDPSSWSYLRIMAGAALKNAIISPPSMMTTATPAISDAEVAQRVIGTPNAAQYAPTNGGANASPGMVEVRMKIMPEASMEIKSILLICLLDEDASVRNMAGSTIASATGRQDVLAISGWPDLMPFLISCLNGERGNAAIDGSLSTLHKLCEDAPGKLDSGALLPTLIPAFLRHLDSPEDRHRSAALQSLNCFIELMPSALVTNMNEYLGGLSKLASDNNCGVRQHVCQAIVSLLSLRTEYLQPHMASVSEFMITATSDTDQVVALEACEFWLTFAALDDEACTLEMVNVVRSLLPRLIPILLKNMVYPRDKVEELLQENAEDESETADRSQDVAPIFHRSRNGKGGEADDDDDDDHEEDGNEWSLRKCSAASLDILSGLYGAPEVLPILLPTLQEGLSHADPWVREASILALGAIAEGCQEYMQEHMAQLYPFLLSQLSADLPQLRSISCWTLSRYSSWIYSQVQTHVQPDIIRNIIELFMKLVLDRNKKVQVASCSAFGVLTESFGELLVPYLEPIYRNLMVALSTYKTRSFMVLCDTLGVMADYIGPDIGEGQLPQIHVAPLIDLWGAHKDPLDRMLLPLMESLACIALTIGPNIQPWALVVFDKCMATIEACMLSVAMICKDDPLNIPRDEESDPIVCSADLLDGLVEGLGSSFETLVSTSKHGEQFLSVLHALCKSDVAGVRMSAFALLGDLANRAPSVIEPGLPQLLQEAIRCIDPLYPSVCNNSIWAIGEICVRCGKNATALSPFAREILAALVPLIMGNSHDGQTASIPGLPENTSATLGRLARVDPCFVKDDLPTFISGWCEGLARIADINERRDAFEGLLLAIHANPQAIISSNNRKSTVTALIFAIISWHIPPNEDGVKTITPEVLHGSYSFQPFPKEAIEVGHALGQLIVQVKEALGSEWDDVAKMPVNVRRLLSEVYQI